MGDLHIEILGSGTSMGVPMVGCACRTCHSADPKDRRLRTSCYIKTGDTELLIDTSADYRQQVLRSGIKRLDAVLYTHHHVDHILGMDDLRSFNLLHRMAIPLYGLPETLDNIRRVFRYAFSEIAHASSVPSLTLNEIDNRPFLFNDVEVTPIPLLHGQLPILGYRVGDFAYCTDVSAIPPASRDRLRGLKVLILGALRYKHHPTHFTIEEATAEALKIGAAQTYFTHISHQVLHAEAEASLPPNIHLAYDGLSFDLSDE